MSSSAAPGVSCWPTPRCGRPISRAGVGDPYCSGAERGILRKGLDVVQPMRSDADQNGGFMKAVIATIALAGALTLSAGLAVAQDIAIAVVGPLTGSNAALGEQMKRGAEMAVADINKKGGVLGKKLELIMADDACDPKQAVAAANDVVA